MKSYRSQGGSSTIIEETIPTKRTTSLVSVQNNGKSPFQIEGAASSPTSMFKSLHPRRLQRIRHRPQMNKKTDNELTTNIAPPVISMPNLMEFSRRLSRSSSIYESDTTITDTQIDSTSPQSFLRRETPIIRSRIPINNENGQQSRRTYANKFNGFVLPQHMSSVDSILKERSVRFQQAASNTLQRANQVFKKQIYLPFERK